MGQGQELVYVVVCDTRLLGTKAKVGAVYYDEEEAREEVRRLRAANPFAQPYYVDRMLPCR